MQKKTDLKRGQKLNCLGAFLWNCKQVHKGNKLYAITIYDTEVSTPCNIRSCTPDLTEMQDNSEFKNCKGKEPPNSFHGTE